MKNLIESILTRQSVRDFAGDSITEKDIEILLKAAMAAPSAVNVQPWAFIVVTDKNLLLDLCKELPYAKMLDKAALAIIVCGIPDLNDIANKYWITDCSAATQNILLAAHVLNYGAVWTAVYPEEDRVSSVRNICGIPENIIPLNVIPIGVPINAASQPKNKYKAENIHRDIW